MNNIPPFNGFNSLKAPISVNLEVSPQCNLKCIFCYVSERRYDEQFCKNPEQETAKNAIFSIIEKISEAEVFQLTLLGGELFHIDNWHDIIKFSADKGFELGFVSNGTLISPAVAKTISKYIHECSISIHGPNSQIHDRLTSVKGSFCRSLSGIKNCLEAGLKIAISYTPVLSNYEYIYDTAKFIGKEFNSEIDTFVINRPTLKGSPKTIQKHIDLNIDNLISLFKQGLKIEKDFKMRVELGDSFPLCKINKKFWHLVSPCGAGTTFTGIDNHGNVRLCPSSDKSVGNIFDQPLKEIWQKSNKLLEFRKGEWLPTECKKCELINKCRGGCYISHKDTVIFGKDQFM